MTKAALYLRVSTTDQTTENQLPALRQIALSRGYEIVAEIHETMSGSKKKRPGLTRILEGAHRGEFNVVLVWSVNRLGRTMSGIGETIQKLDGYGCRTVSYQDPWLDMKGALREFLIAVFGFAAQLEREQLIERTNAGLATARKNGKSLGRPKVAFDIDEAFRLRKAGHSIRETARRLDVGVGTLHRALEAFR